ncbi:MAG: hypothetical protein Q4C49_07915 [Bacillota bacterium]|nr:hypothetical protein [Bacillota bacterium]
MINVEKYEWLDNEYNFNEFKDMESEIHAVLNYIQKREWENGKKKAVFSYYFNQVKNGQKKSFKTEKEVGKYVKNLISSPDYLQVAQEATKKDKRTFTMYGIGMAFTFTAFLYCLFGAIRRDNILDPTLQIVVAVVSIVVCAWAYRKRNTILCKYADETKTYMVHDLIFILIAIVCKAIGTGLLDVTIILMGMDVWFTSRDFNETIERVLK